MKFVTVSTCMCVLFMNTSVVWTLTYSTIAGNYAKLLELYSTYSFASDFIPISNYSNAMTVIARMKMYAISDYDEVAGAIELAASLQMNWNDEIVQAINGSIYSSVYQIGTSTKLNTLIVPYTSIWTPEVILYSAVGTSVSIGNKSFMCRYDITSGAVEWNPRMLMKSACSPDVTYYPFDRQTCTISFVVWGHTVDELQFQVNENEWDLSSYEENGEWEVIETSSSTQQANNQSILQLKLIVERKPLYFSFNIIFPVIILCVLNGMVFWLPIDSGERIGFSITCFLSFVVLLNTIMDFLPRTSSPMSYLCYYLVIMMLVSGFVTAVVMLEIRLYHRDASKEKVPTWLRVAIQSVSCFKRCRNPTCARCCRNDVESSNSTLHDEVEEPVKGPTKSIAVQPTRLRKFTKSTNKKDDRPVKSPSSTPEDDFTWKDVVKFLDKLLFLCFLGAEAFFSISFLVPMVYRA